MRHTEFALVCMPERVALEVGRTLSAGGRARVWVCTPAVAVRAAERDDGLGVAICVAVHKTVVGSGPHSVVAHIPAAAIVCAGIAEVRGLSAVHAVQLLLPSSHWNCWTH